MNKEQFAQELGFETWEDLLEQTNEIHRLNDVSFYVTNTDPYNRKNGLKWATWDDFELSADRVEFFWHQFEAEDAATVGYALAASDDAAEQFMTVLQKLADDLSIPHREGHCEHAGYCELVPVLIDFLNSPEGAESLAGFGDWYSSETPSDIFEKIFGSPMNSADWIADDELPSWHAFVKENDTEHALADTYYVVTASDGKEYELLIQKTDDNNFKFRVKGNGESYFQDANYWAGFCEKYGVDIDALGDALA